MKALMNEIKDQNCETCHVAEFKVVIGDVITSIHWDDLEIYAKALYNGTQDECRTQFLENAKQLGKTLQERNPEKSVKVRWNFEGISQGHYHTRTALGDTY